MNPAPNTEGLVFVQPETVAVAMEILAEHFDETRVELWRDDERGGDGFFHHAHDRVGELYERLPDAVACGEVGVVQEIIGMAEAMA